MIKGLMKLTGAALSVGALAAGPQAQAEIVALRADGTQAYIHDPVSGQIVSTIVPVSSGVPWAGVAAFDVDPSRPGDELIFTRRLDRTSGADGGFEVYSSQSGSDRLGHTLGQYHYRAVTAANVLDGGTRAGLVGLRADLSSGGKAVFEVWDPVQIIGGGGRIEFHLGFQTDGDWDANVIAAAELSADTPGDEIVVLRSHATNQRLVEFYSRTNGSGNVGYTRTSASSMTRPVETFTIAKGILPDGGDAFVFLREDGRLSFWTTGFMTDNDPNANRLAFTPADGGYENFVRVADVLETHAGQELIVGYHDADSGVRGYRVLGLPTNYAGGYNEVTLPVLGTYDLGAEIRNIDLVAIPEPASAGLLTCGLLAMLRRRR